MQFDCIYKRERCYRELLELDLVYRRCRWRGLFGGLRERVLGLRRGGLGLLRRFIGGERLR